MTSPKIPEEAKTKNNRMESPVAMERRHKAMYLLKYPEGVQYD